MAEGSSLQSAREPFEAVVDDYVSGEDDEQDRIADLAAEAYAGLGFIALGVDSAPDKALDLFTRAIDLNPARDRRLVFLAARAGAYEQLGRTDEAATDCEVVASVGSGSDCPLLIDELIEDLTEALPFTGFSSELVDLAIAGMLLLSLGWALLGVAARKPGVPGRRR